MAVAERFKQEIMYGLSAGTKKSGRCREVAVVERWPLVEVRLYIYIYTKRGNIYSVRITKKLIELSKTKKCLNIQGTTGCLVVSIVIDL